MPNVEKIVKNDKQTHILAGRQADGQTTYEKQNLKQKRGGGSIN